MTTTDPVPDVVRTFVSAWTRGDPSLATGCVTADVVVQDPNGRIEGPAALGEHLEAILRRFDFPAVTFERCVVGADQVALVFRIDMVGRSSRIAGVRTGFTAACFADLEGGRIKTWTEYWDPAPMARTLEAALAR